jgi:hypothetical protein
MRRNILAFRHRPWPDHAAEILTQHWRADRSSSKADACQAIKGD